MELAPLTETDLKAMLGNKEIVIEQLVRRIMLLESSIKILEKELGKHGS